MQLHKKLLFEPFAPENERIHWWEPPKTPDFAGPGDLAALLINYRQFLARHYQETGRSGDTVGDLSDAALTSLLKYAYNVSFLTEEGRPVLARFFVRPTMDAALAEVFKPVIDAWNRDWERHTHVHLFTQPRPLTDRKMVAKLAPTLVAPDAVLLVREAEGQPIITGIGLLNHDNWENKVLDMPREGNGNRGLLLEILGPGYLRVSEGQNQYTLRANELLVDNRMWDLAPVQAWLLEVSQVLVDSALKHGVWSKEDKTHVGLADLPNEFPQIDVLITWSRVLREALHLRHGGTFIVVPDLATAPIVKRFPTQPFSLGEKIVDSWLALRQTWRHKPEEDVLQLVNDERCAVHRLLAASRSVAALSATDGCVVLDRTLTLHCFGGSIEVQKDQCEPPKKLLSLLESGEVSLQMLDTLGERHKSAYRLCQCVPGTLAFVISQDGDLRFFSSDSDAVLLC